MSPASTIQPAALPLQVVNPARIALEREVLRGVGRAIGKAGRAMTQEERNAPAGYMGEAAGIEYVRTTTEWADRYSIHQPSAEDLAIEGERRAALDTFASALPSDRERAVLHGRILAAYDGHREVSQDELALLLGVNVRTIRRDEERLRSLLAERSLELGLGEAP